MASVYDYETGQAMTEGLQGSNVCDEALMTAQSMADNKGEPVELVDDDGRWLVHPARDGSREPATTRQDRIGRRASVLNARRRWADPIGD